MHYFIKHTQSGQRLTGIDEDGYGIFSDNVAKACHGENPESLNAFIAANNLSNVSIDAADNTDPGGDRPPTGPRIP